MAFGNIGAVVDQQGVVALGKALNVIVDMGGFGGGDDLLPGCLRTAVSDILIDRPVKEPGVLENHGIGQAQALSCQQGGDLGICCLALFVNVRGDRMFGLHQQDKHFSVPLFLLQRILDVLYYC